MRYLTTSQEMKMIDQESISKIGIPGMVLMENAAVCMYHVITERFTVDDSICIVVGTGNNGGDGLALARLLIEHDYPVTVQIIGNMEKASEEFLKQYTILEKLDDQKYCTAKAVCYEHFKVLIDGIFGVGLSREVTGTYAEIIEQMNQSPAYKIAIDAPSGICCTTGRVLGVALRCDLTITFGLMKRGLLLYPGYDHAGEIIVADIGFPKNVVIENEPTAYTYGKEDLKKLPKRFNDSHKGNYGRILIIAGTTNMAGACYFSAKAAYLCGCGVVEIFTTEANRSILQTLIPEAVLTTYHNKEEAIELLSAHMEFCDAAVIGPGMGQNKTTIDLLEMMLMEYTGKLVIDADACDLLAQFEDHLSTSDAEIVLTPHMKEASRIFDLSIPKIKEDPIKYIYDYAVKNNVTFILKDSRTLISFGERLTYINSSGNNGMATGGSGDVLTGIIAGFCAGGLEIKEAAALGVYCHGLAGDYARDAKGAYSLLASDILDHIPDVLKQEA